jgi:hypothetical protein
MVALKPFYLVKKFRRYMKCNFYIFSKRKEIIAESTINSLVPIYTELLMDNIHHRTVDPIDFVATHIESYFLINIAFLMLNTIRQYNISAEELDQ